LDNAASSTTNIIDDIASSTIDFSKYDVIYHLAALIGGGASINKPIETYRINICGTINLLRNFKGLFIFTSTAGIYEPLKSPYFLSKYICEEMIRNAPCKHLIFRLANPYGKGSKLVIQKWLATNRIEIYGDGNQTRDFVYIDDVIEILENPFKLKVNETYNVGTGKLTTLNELARLITELKGSKKIDYLPARAFEIYEPTMKPDIKCKTSLKEGLLKILKETPT
jgi:UDP-glucose 4-epimerase